MEQKASCSYSWRESHQNADHGRQRPFVLVCLCFLPTLHLKFPQSNRFHGFGKHSRSSTLPCLAQHLIPTGCREWNHWTIAERPSVASVLTPGNPLPPTPTPPLQPPSWHDTCQSCVVFSPPLKGWEKDDLSVFLWKGKHWLAYQSEKASHYGEGESSSQGRAPVSQSSRGRSGLRWGGLCSRSSPKHLRKRRCSPCSWMFKWTWSIIQFLF